MDDRVAMWMVRALAETKEQQRELLAAIGVKQASIEWMEAYLEESK